MTLKDIAQRAGVSTMTVSNVINGKNARVSEKTREKINALIKECGYVPNLSARSLTNKVSNIIGIIISLDAGMCENYLENPYISTMIGTIERVLRQSGYFVMVRSIEKTTDYSTLLLNWNVDGVIFLYPPVEEKLRQLLSVSTCPVAVFDCPTDLPDLIRVCADDRQGLYLATSYLIRRGHTHICFAADYEGNPLLTERFLGYRQALADHGIPFRDEYVIPNPPSYKGGIEAGKQICALKAPVTAAVATADICAIGIMEGARQSGRRIPADLSVIGFDNLSLCLYTTPHLTSVSQNLSGKAQLAAELLLEQIRTGTTEGARHVTMEVTLAERESVCEPSAESSHSP